MINRKWKRPLTAAEVCENVHNSEEFGRNIRDWQHELQKMKNRREFAKRIADPPPLLRDRLNDFGQSDAYLAAYVEWLCRKVGLEAPSWTDEPVRIADRAWYDHPPLWKQSLVLAPSAFRRRHIFTKPEFVLQFRAGRPRVSEAHRKRKNAERQKRYRDRIREKLERLTRRDQ